MQQLYFKRQWVHSLTVFVFLLSLGQQSCGLRARNRSTLVVEGIARLLAQLTAVESQF